LKKPTSGYDQARICVLDVQWRATSGKDSAIQVNPRSTFSEVTAVARDIGKMAIGKLAAMTHKVAFDFPKVGTRNIVT